MSAITKALASHCSAFAAPGSSGEAQESNQNHNGDMGLILQFLCQEDERPEAGGS